MVTTRSSAASVTLAKRTRICSEPNRKGRRQMPSKTEKKIARQAEFLAEHFPKAAKRIRHEHAQRAKRVAKRGSHPKSK